MSGPDIAEVFPPDFPHAMRQALALPLAEPGMSQANITRYAYTLAAAGAEVMRIARLMNSRRVIALYFHPFFIIFDFFSSSFILFIPFYEPPFHNITLVSLSFLFPFSMAYKRTARRQRRYSIEGC